MLCTILLIFSKKFKKLKIELRSGSDSVTNKFYKPLGFNSTKFKDVLVLEDILPLIYGECKYCSDDVKLIFQYNDRFIKTSEKMMKLIE